jgi:hypothetical protein
LLVAKSLAVGRGDNNYMWLFENEDETPTDGVDRGEESEGDEKG